MNMADVDLNLLTALDVLLEEQNVSRAAERLGVTQPAVSSTLKRLRTLFGDQILVRTSEGMLPTERAKRLRPRVRAALAELQALVEDDEGFDPTKVERIVNIGVNDYASLCVLPEVYPVIRKAAPKLRLVLQPRKNITTAREDLESGNLDFVIGIGLARELPGSLIVKRLFDDPFVTMVRAGHPLVKREITMKQFLEAEHLVVSPQGHARGIIDDMLQAKNLSRHVALVVPHFAVAARLVAESDRVCTIPGRIAALFQAAYDLKIMEPPLPIHESNICLAWHQLQHETAANRWLRELFSSVFAERRSK